ncbi:glycosyltransferase [Flavobacterium paronense]|uniref:Glycosyltransferase n=1 Tax=Flavobacterium paronense TaxID=1392775 RepID=A0ABV5GAM4_9FLAO|nr:glycosyltransferase [Flavobacterium paronense]MDN3676673.1 glycosyltransferase [Flavobacterium paronense]
MKNNISTKKILIVTNGFYPENSPRSLRATELAKEFVKQGHSVKVITHHRPGVDAFCNEQSITYKDMGGLTWPEITIKGTGVIKLFWRVALRFSKLLFEYPQIQTIFLLKKALKNESGYDLLVSVAVPYPIHWGVASSRTKKHRIAKVWAADCGDPYMGQRNDTFRPPFYFGWLEKNFCKKADYIVIPFEGAKTAYYPEFLNKIKVIPQGLSFPPITVLPQKNAIITFAYAGNIGSYLPYAIPFLNYLNSLEKDFRFIIYTKEKDIFNSNLNPETLQKCVFYEYKDRSVLLNELSTVDFLLHFPYRVAIQKSLKLIDYFYIKKPILSFTNDTESYATFNAFLNYDFSNQIEHSNVDDYYIENVASNFLNLIN